jgi:hypothetical protein
MAIGIGLVQFYIGKTKLDKNCRTIKELNARFGADGPRFFAKRSPWSRYCSEPIHNLATGEP